MLNPSEFLENLLNRKVKVNCKNNCFIGKLTNFDGNLNVILEDTENNFQELFIKGSNIINIENLI